jgi:uncharacterized coiled-coil protein SlyX
MSGSALEDNDNIKRNGLVGNNEALIVDNRNAEATEPGSASSESLLFQEEIQMTLREFNHQIKEYDRSIKRIEKRMAALYVKLDRIPEAEESNTSSKKKSKKKKGKTINKKGKKKIKKLKGKGKTKTANALTNKGKKRVGANSKNRQEK